MACFRLHPRSVLVAAASVLILAGCSTAVPSPSPSPSTSQGPSTDTGTVTPPPASAGTSAPPASAPATAEPSPRPSASPSPSPATSGPTWREVGTFAGSGEEGVALVAFDGGYVAFGNTDAGPLAWVSTDGRLWRKSVIDPPTAACPGRPAARVSGGAASGREILLVGSELVPGATGCEATETRTVTWLSSDGRSWRKSERFAPEGVWAVAGGWEGLTSELHAIALWRSSDGIAWQPVSLPVDVVPNLTGDYWPAPNGTTLMLVDATGSGDPDRETLDALGPDGHWRPVDYPASCPWGNWDLVLPPSVHGPNLWLLSDGLATCASSDLVHWRRGTIPVKDACPAPIEYWVNTRQGILATVSINDPMCTVEFQLLSRDGLTWTVLKSATVPDAIAEGPAGLIGLDAKVDATGLTTEVTVWRLDP